MSRAWQNWSQTSTCVPGQIVAPASVDSLAAVLAAGHAPVRVMGSSHSWAPLGLGDPDYTLMTLAGPAFEGLHGEVDGDGRVWVGAATRLLQLHGLLAAHRRSLSNVGSISAQTLAGLTATGTHGTGRLHPCLSAAASGVRLVTAAGEIREYTDENHAREMGFLRLSLGCLGVITALRIATVPLFYIAVHQSTVPLGRGPDVLAELVAAEDWSGRRHRFSWFPHGRRARIQAFEAVPAPDQLPVPFDRAGLRFRLEGKLLGEWLFGHGLLRLCRGFPLLMPAVMRFADRVHFQDWDTPRVGRMFEQINEHGIPRHHETEWAIPLEAAPEAWRAMRSGIESRGLPADFLQELRTARQDGIALSAARERDVCWVGVYQTTAHRWEDTLSFAEDVLGGLGGRPHWGKWFDPARVASRVGAEFEAFEAFRAEMDPTGRFLGPWHRRCGLGTHGLEGAPHPV